MTIPVMARARSDLSTAEKGAKLDAVVLGCPHFSYAEFRQLAQVIQSERHHLSRPVVRLIVVTNQVAYALLQRSVFVNTIADFGVEIVLDTCVMNSPIISSDAKVMMTNSGKWAYYAPGELGVRVAFGGLCDCIRSATQGFVQRGETSWKKP